MNGDVKSLRAKTFRQCNGAMRFGGQIHVKNPVAFVAIKMAMLVHVRAKASRPAVQSDLPHKAGFHERIQAVIDRRMRNFRHLLFRTDKNFIRRGMIALVLQHVINLLPLRRKTETVRRQAMAEI